MKHEGSTFLSGCAAAQDFFFFAKSLDEMEETGQPNSSFFRFKQSDPDDQFRKYDDAVGWPAISMATTKHGDSPRLVVAIGPHGDYWELAPATTVETTGKIARFRGNLRKLSVIGGVVHACGMGRVVLRREAAGKWQSLGPGAQESDPEVIGFEDLAGYGPDELYAVGWHGELWWSDAGKWRRIKELASQTLTAVTCAADLVYVVGHGGTLIRGRRDQWEVVKTLRTEDLRDVAVHQGQVYVCTDRQLLKLAKDKLVAEAAKAFAEPKDQPKTCLALLEAPDGVISMGPKDVFRRSDGPWARLV